MGKVGNIMSKKQNGERENSRSIQKLKVDVAMGFGAD